ncbi:MAG TPA: hypothetical protein VIM64_09545 [Puia sp.]
MILDDNTLVEILKTNPAKAMLAAARIQAKQLYAIVYGKDILSLIKEMPYFENADVMQIRKDCAKSLKDVMQRVLGERDKVYTAEGGSDNFSLTESQEKEMRRILTNVHEGQSLRKWVQQNSMPAFDCDPMSLTFMEWDAVSTPYPTYKSTSCIFDYRLTGRQPEYVIFDLSKEDKIKLKEYGLSLPIDKKCFRVVDDIADKYIIWDSEQMTKVAVYPNYFLKVPAKLNSNKPLFTSHTWLSSIDKVEDLCIEMIRDRSVEALVKLFQGYPKEWGLLTVCTECNGSTMQDGGNCKACNGTGHKLHTKIADRVLIDPGGENRDAVPIPPGGYMVPPVDGIRLLMEIVMNAEARIRDTIWGTNDLIKTTGTSIGEGGNNIKTATQVVEDNQPKKAVLNQYREWAQDMCKFIADSISQVLYNKHNACSILFGNRYNLESPDALFVKFTDAKSKGVPFTILRELYLDYLNAEYADDPVELKRLTTLMDVEPFPFNNMSEVVAMMIPDQQKQDKIYYGAWLGTKTRPEIVFSDVEALRADLTAYASAYKMERPEPTESEIGFKTSKN